MKEKISFFLSFRSAFINVSCSAARLGQDKMRLGNARKISFFLSFRSAFIIFACLNCAIRAQSTNSVTFKTKLML